MLKRLIILLALSAAVLGGAGCRDNDSDSPAEKAGEKIEDAGAAVQDKAEDAGDTMEDAADHMEDKVDENTN